MVCDTTPSQDAYTDQIWNSYLKEYERYVRDTIILKTRSEVKVIVTRKRYVTLGHPKMQLYSEFVMPISKNRRYAPDSMQFLETRSEVKFKVSKGAKIRNRYNQVPHKVTKTQLWYATLCHLKMHQQTKFGIPTSKNIGDMLRTQ